MFSYSQAILLGALQGITELFPISSLGHSVILPQLLGWNIDQSADFFLTFLVATHFATAIVLLIFFWQDWVKIFSGLFRSLKAGKVSSEDHDAHLGWLLVVGTVPAGVLGLLFEQNLKKLFADPYHVAIFLILNGFLLAGGEILRRKTRTSPAKLNWSQSIKIGFLQCIALLPGFSRTGATLTGGLLVGLTHEDAVKFSFLLATPIIGAAAILKLPELLSSSVTPFVGPILIGSIASAITAYFSVKFLTKYFETNKLTPFAIYCGVVGVVSLLWL